MRVTADCHSLVTKGHQQLLDWDTALKDVELLKPILLKGSPRHNHCSTHVRGNVHEGSHSRRLGTDEWLPGPKCTQSNVAVLRDRWKVLDSDPEVTSCTNIFCQAAAPESLRDPASRLSLPVAFTLPSMHLH